MSAAEALATYLRAPAPPVRAIPLAPEISSHIRTHGVGPLVYRAMRDHARLDAQPAAVRDELARLARQEALIEPFRRAETERVLGLLAAEGVPVLVFKGTALAYTCYPDPALRPRLDTDLFIRREDITPVSRVFDRLGYARTLRTSGEHVTHQFTYVGSRHDLQLAFDIHWKLSDPQAFADLFTFEELNRDARSIPALGSHARTPCAEHALLVACAHRVAHHFDQEFLIDLCDIDLLARTLDQSAWRRVASLAAARRLRRVVLRGLQLAADRLGTPIPIDVHAALAAAGEAEPTAAYLVGGLRRVDVLRADLQALGWRDRLHLLREHLFPDPTFVLRSFRSTQPAMLPAFYVIRIARGARSWFRPLR